MDGLLPTSRGGHSVSVLGRLLYIFGGCDSSMQCFNDLHSYNTDTHLWQRLNSTGDPPSPRGGHSALFLGTRLLIFGGSAKGLEYNDLYEYEAITDHWKNLLPEGERPPGRCNHAADIDSEGNLVVVGGFSSRGYLNDLHVYSTAYNKWVRFQTTGIAPTPRELHSFNIQDKIGYLFGGFHEGGVSGELYLLDLEMMRWTQVEDDGYFPEAREGHAALRVAEFLYVVGGCDFGLETCYNDMYVLDLLTMWWTKLEHRPFTPLPALKERMGAAVVGALVFTFGGCYLNKRCFNDVMMINTGLECQCNGNGVCRGGICICDKGYSGPDCLIRASCKEDCLLRGFCTSSGLCDCYPGYKGRICEYESECPSNCTGTSNGRCQPDGHCSCNTGYSGPSCTCECVHGYCLDSGCFCKVGWIGDKCDLSDPSFSGDTADTPETSSEEGTSDTPIEDSTSDVDTTSEDLSEETSVDDTVDTEAVTAAEDTTEIEEVAEEAEEAEDEEEEEEVEEVEEEAAGAVLTDEETTSPAYTQNIKETQFCSECKHGKCSDLKCYCEKGWTGKYCDDSTGGVTAVYASGLTLLSLILGAGIAYCYLSLKKPHAEPEEYPLFSESS